MIVAAAAIVVGARSAEAQVLCNDASKLPNPIIVSGTAAFERSLAQFAVRLSGDAQPATVILASAALSSCTGIASVANRLDLAGTTGFYYLTNGTSFTREPCTFAAGQTPDVAMSELFYESCLGLPQPKPADLSDTLGPVEMLAFVAPQGAGTESLTYDEAKAIYGCGVSSAKPIAGFKDPGAIFCWSQSSDPPTLIGSLLGMPSTALAAPRCVDNGATSLAFTSNLSIYISSNVGALALGFMRADGLPGSLSEVLAFQSKGQTQAYYPDSRPGFEDRRNVRDGHYTPWAYEHLFAKTSGGAPNQQAAALIAWITGARSSAAVDHVAIDIGVGLIPQCAMRVKRSADGGLLSPYTPAEACGCDFVATLSKAVPPDCTLCLSQAACPSGLTCRRGFCQ